MKKRIVSLVLAAAMTAAAITGCGKLDGSAVVAEVGEEKITADVANFYARYQQAQYETYYASFMGTDLWAGEAQDGKTYEESIKESIMESLETLYVLDAHKSEYNVELTDEEKENIKKAAESFADANGKEEKEVISGDAATVQKVLELLTIQEKMRVEIGKGADTEVSDEEAAQKKLQYVRFPFTTTDADGNQTTLSDEEKAELKEKAEAFKNGAADADDFEAFAKEQGYEATSVTFDDESTSLPQNLLIAADMLKEGEVTTVVEDTSAYYVGKLISLLDREATDTKKTTIVSERKQELFNDTCEKWRKDAGVKVHKSTWNKIDFVKQGVTIKSTDTETEE
ncbi:peptidyl-prolyl cis-trans isomerase [Roseburia hominis]